MLPLITSPQNFASPFCSIIIFYFLLIWWDHMVVQFYSCHSISSKSTLHYYVASSYLVKPNYLLCPTHKAKKPNFCRDINVILSTVSELGPEDSSRNIVEIIFKSSWLKKDNPICSIERILKVHNTQRTIQRFEDCRDAVKIRANNNTKKNPRCAADGNELLRFHCTTLTCSLGARGSSSLCGSVPGCGVCTIIRHGFQGNKSSGVRTTASSGRAHDCLGIPAAEAEGGRSSRAMLVCRVIAGRVKRVVDDTGAEAAPEEDAGASLAAPLGSYDSLAGYAGIYSNLEELYVFNPRAILPCFVVIYKALES